MKSFTVDAENMGQRLNKYCLRILTGASQSFVYKMLRKKNITLNGKKAAGNELLSEGDEVKFFLSDDTFAKFSEETGDNAVQKSGESRTIRPIEDERVIFEDENIIVCHKNIGELSQKVKDSDISVNERIAAFLEEKKMLWKGFRFGIANRLDRNTDGLVIGGKNPHAQAVIAKMFKTHSIEKYYLAAVKGKVGFDRKFLRLWLSKDEKNNKVSIYDSERQDCVLTETEAINIKAGKYYSLLKIKLLTGKSHQIRACLAYTGHPVAGDPKYGDADLNAYLRRKYGIRNQLLTAYELKFPEENCELPGLAGKSIKTALAGRFNEFIENEIKAD